MALTWKDTKDNNRSRKLCFHHPWHVLVIRGNPDLHFEGAGNGPVVITWIGREHALYSGASPISLVEHCVLFDMIQGSYRTWDLYTTGQLVDGLQQKKRKTVFMKWNYVVFSRATILSFHPVEGYYRSWDLYTTGQLVDGRQQKKKEKLFSLNGNGIMSSFLGRQFYRSTL